MKDEELLVLTRIYIQRVLIPIVAAIGIAGNLLTVVVLTRKRMRSSTNIYLTALAIADITFLFFSFVLTFQHYPNIHHPKYILYWSFYGLTVWFRDAAAYISIYLTVCFTLERYISVCHPLRGQVLCTESRAKKVIAAVFIVCFLFTITTPFEYLLKNEALLVHDDTTDLCVKDMSLAKNISTYAEDHGLLPPSVMHDMSEPKVVVPAGASQTHESLSSKAKRDEQSQLNSTNSIPLASENQDKPGDKNVNEAIEKTINDMIHKNGCVWINYTYIVSSDLGSDTTYRNIFFSLTTFSTVLLPLILITIFNCYLVAAVHRSHNLRRRMTSARQDDSSTSQENKVTITLIAVVVLFLVCQVPLAVQTQLSIYATEPTAMRLILNNILNFLTDINAASNFILYCALSDKYRKTVRSLICGRNIARRNTLTSSRFLSSRTATSFYSKTNNSNGSFFKPARRFNPKSLTIVEPKRFSISKEEYENLKTEAEKLKWPRKSDSSQQSAHESRKNSTAEEIPMKAVKKGSSPLRNIRFSISSVDSHKDVGLQKDDSVFEALETPTDSPVQETKNDSAKRDSITSQASNRSQSRTNPEFLRPSPSESSFTRTRSLNLPPKIKHSPDCKDNPVKL